MATAKTAATVSIKAPNFQYAEMGIRGIAPYVQNAFPEKARVQMHDDHVAGSVPKKGKAKVSKDFDAMYVGSQHVTAEGWRGIPSNAFRNAMISACRTVGYQMTRAKLGFFV